MIGPAGIDCPEWPDDNVPVAEFESAKARVYSAVAAASGTAVLDERSILEWHGGLFHGFVPLDYYAGNFRQHDPTRICLGQDVAVAGVPGADYRLVVQKMHSLLDDVALYIRQLEIGWEVLTPRERALRVAQITALLVGRFIQIHPFINGNGRVSRLLWAWGTFRYGLPPQCRISPRPVTPYPTLMAAAMRGDLAPLALHILQAMATRPPSR